MMKQTRYVYLAGPISGCTSGEANDWRNEFQKRMPKSIVGISPLRCEPLIGDKYGLFYDDPRFGTPGAIATKNYFDVANCDLTLAYLPHLSLGTCIEIGWAHGLKKPIIVVSEEKGIADHPLILRSAGWVVKDLNTGIEIVEGLFTDYA